MTKPEFDKQVENTRFDVQNEAQKQKMNEATQTHSANKIKGATEPNAGGQNRETGHRKG